MSVLFRKSVNAQYYVKRGQECLKKGDYPWALESFSKAIEYFPDCPVAYCLRAQIYKKMGKQKEAVNDCIKFLEVDRKAGAASSGAMGPVQIAQIGLNVAGISICSDIIELLGTAKDQVDNYRYEDLKANAQKEIALFGIPAILDGLIEDYSPQQAYQNVAFYNLALRDLEKNTSQKKYYQGFARLLLNDYETAAGAFSQAIEEEPHNSNAYYLRGVAYLKKMQKSENNEEASAYFESANSDFYQSLKNDPTHKICARCGLREKSGLRFCAICGARLLSPN